jgi:hypothetical protein
MVSKMLLFTSIRYRHHCYINCTTAAAFYQLNKTPPDHFTMNDEKKPVTRIANWVVRKITDSRAF